MTSTSNIVNHFIGNREVEPTGDTLAVTNPATGQEVRRVALGDATTVAAAVESATMAFPRWAATPAPKRAQHMFRLRELLLRDADAIAAVLTEEHGKILSDARAEVQRGLEVVELACGIPQLLKGEHSPQVATDVDVTAYRQPLGVVAGITPFNFPAMVPMWMFPLAIAAGNTFVLKPSEQAPSAAAWMARLTREAGFPEGVFNVVHGDRVASEALIDADAVRAVSFVGSTPVARSIYERCAERGKRCQALGGAKNHLVVLPDADLDAATEALIGAAFGAAGERCMAVSVAVAVGDIADTLVERLTARAQQLKVRDGTDPEADFGPLISAAHRERVAGLVTKGVEEGATLRLDGRDMEGEGHFFGPTILDDVTTEMTCYREEIFGPVLGIVRVPDTETALRVCNGHAYANGVALFSNDGAAARAFAQRVHAGMVGINVPIPVPVAFHSFGGWKASLFGDHHIYGTEGVRFYTQLKTITSRWSTDKVSAELSMPTTRS